MKTHARHFVICSLTAGLAFLCGCGESEPPPGPAPTTSKKPSGQPSTKSDGAAKSKPAEASGWGDLKGRFVFDGAAPAPALLPITVDQAYCSDKMVKDESLLVDANGGLANVVIFLRTPKTPIHDDHKKGEAAEVPFANEKCRFNPHIQLLRPKQTLKVLNLDPVEHNTKFDHPDGGNPNLPAKSELFRQLSETRLPSAVRCNKHPWMAGYILVRENPYMTVSKADGTFEIKNLPAGVELTFQAWHEKSQAENNLLDLRLPGWDRGRFTVTIEAGKPKDLEEIKVPALLLGKGN